MKSWIALASADHVARGRDGGFMQVCHGKQGPLKRIHPGDRVVYYSPARTMGGKDRLQSFTALGRAKDRAPYLFDTGGGFCPFRRDVVWDETRITPIKFLLEHLEFTRGKTNWGYAFRFGLLEISHHDGDLIAQAMGAKSDDPDQSQPLLL